MDTVRFQQMTDDIHYAVIDGYYAIAEKLICRAAAEISGLTAVYARGVAARVAFDCGIKDAPLVVALRRFAELAAGDA